MIGSEIIARYNVQVDDSSELSSSEELDLLNEIYVDICTDRPWEWLKTTATGSTSTTVPYIALPADFKEIIANKDGYSVVFVGTDYQEYKVIPFSSRRDHRDENGFCYIDIPNQRLYFTLQPTSVKAIEYDYVKNPTLLTTTTYPLFDTTTGNKGLIISYGMAARFAPIEGTNKVTSYANENIVRYKELLFSLQMEDTNIKLSQ